MPFSCNVWYIHNSSSWFTRYRPRTLNSYVLQNAMNQEQKDAITWLYWGTCRCPVHQANTGDVGRYLLESLCRLKGVVREKVSDGCNRETIMKFAEERGVKVVEEVGEIP
jgi:hypothetical protein